MTDLTAKLDAETLKEWAQDYPHSCAAKRGFRCNTCDIRNLSRALLAANEEIRKLSNGTFKYQISGKGTETGPLVEMVPLSRLAASQREVAELSKALEAKDRYWQDKAEAAESSLKLANERAERLEEAVLSTKRSESALAGLVTFASIHGYAYTGEQFMTLVDAAIAGLPVEGWG